MARICCANCDAINDREIENWPYCDACGMRLSANGPREQPPASVEDIVTWISQGAPADRTPNGVSWINGSPPQSRWERLWQSGYFRLIMAPVVMGGIFAVFTFLLTFMSAAPRVGIKSRGSHNASPPATWDDVAMAPIYGFSTGAIFGLAYVALVLVILLRDWWRTRRNDSTA